MWYTGSAWQPLSRTDPPNTYIVDGITYQSLTSAYNGCVANNSSGATTGSACTYTTSSATPFSSCPTSFSGTDVYKAQFGRIVLVEQQ
jgi:hypothetical protein